jgi:ABC-type uncharacterized transport system permease subunit
MIAEIAMQAGIYWFMALGLWINLRVVRYADLSVESTLVLSAMITCGFAAAGFRGLGSVVLTLLFCVPFALLVAGFAWTAWKALRVHAVIVSLALGFVLYSVSLESFGAMKDGSGLPKLRSDYQGLAVVFGGILAVSFILQLIRHSSMGRRLLAAVGNPPLARALDIEPGLWQWIGLTSGTFLIMISGILHACYYTYVNIGDAAGFLLLGIFCAVLVANGLCPRVVGFWNGVATLFAVAVFQAIITMAIYAGFPINLNKGLMGLLLIVAVALLRYKRVSHPITLS